MAKLRPRSEIASEEITSNPIFLFQRRMVIPNQECLAEYDSDKECLVHPDTKEPMDGDALLEYGWGFVYWITEKVFSTREEGEEYGETRKYNYGKGRKGIDWMVYCIPCGGELAQILNIRPEILEFALNMEHTMQAKTEKEKDFWENTLQLNKFGKKYGADYWKDVPIEVLERDLHEAIVNLAHALCTHPHEKEIISLSTELAMYCMMNAQRAQAEK